MQRKIIYLINPISGTKGKDQALALIHRRTAAAGIPYEVIPTNAEGNYYFLKDQIEQHGVTDVVICGGDGTIRTVVAALVDEPVNVGIIPLGSGNGLAFGAGISKDPEKALDIIFAGNAKPVDAFFLNEQFCCMLCGIGFDAQVAHEFAKQSTRGLATYVKQTVRNFFVAAPYQFEITTRQGTIKTEAYFISIANSNQFGNQFTIAPQASLSDGLLDIVVAQKSNKIRFLMQVLQQVRNGTIQSWEKASLKKKGILYFQASKLSILNPHNAPLHMDGDPASSTHKFSIQVIPHAYRLLQPVS